MVVTRDSHDFDRDRGFHGVSKVGNLRETIRRSGACQPSWHCLLSLIRLVTRQRQTDDGPALNALKSEIPLTSLLDECVQELVQKPRLSIPKQSGFRRNVYI